VSKEILAKLRDVGQVLFDTLLSAKAKEALRSSSVNDLVFHIEDTLVQIPWELLYDGRQFLCQKFNMGRIVKTKREVFNIRQRMLSRPLKMLIVSDPRGDLENSGREGRLIREQLDRNTAFISANQRSGQITPAYIMEKIRNFDLVHYAGHADYDTADPANSGWLLEGGKFTSADIVKLIGGKPMPALVFCNACQTGQTQEWKLGSGYNQKIFGLANAFLLAGVQHYVGTFWEILDEPGAGFAVEFYRAMTEGASIGEAIRQARLLLIKQYGEDTIVWASYMLYGDPGFSYFDFAEEEAGQEAAGAAPQDFKEAAQLRSASDETVSFARPAAASRRFVGAVAAAVVLLVIAGILLVLQRTKEPAGDADPYLKAYGLLHAGRSQEARLGFEGLPQTDPRHFEGLAAVFYELGDTKTALEMCSRALALAPYNVYSAVIKGNILFSQGKLDEALQEYSAAIERKGGISWQHAEACNGIARIHSSRGDMQLAAEFYARAAAHNPASAEIFSNQAVALQRTGNSAGALDALQKATQANPGDRLASVMLADTLRRQKADEDKARQERVDRLVSELAASFKAGTARTAAGDTWTSKPVAISFLNFASKGAPAEREGEDDYFLLQLSALLQESGSVQIVERELLDSLLAELKLSSTELVDPATSLKLGRILSARVIATGTLMRYNRDIQLSLRLTDTETTLLKGAVTAADKDLEQLSRTAAQKILEKIKAAYPLRGVITAVSGNQAVLNIGAAAGVQDGMQFRVLEEAKAEKGALPLLRPAGTVTVASVSQDSAAATGGDQAPGLKPGLKVEQIIR
jgi:tetratricopeptide (TPR) repeat protein